MPLGELRERMSSAEMSAWYALNGIYPIGEERADFRNALLLQQQAALNRARGRHVPPIEDFLPFRIKPPEEDWSPEQMANAWKAALGKS